MNDWAEKYMSSGAKEELVKSVIQAIPSYAMSVFKFSVGLCDELEQIIRNFWWGDELDRRKPTGGLGIKLQSLNTMGEWV
jgi:hypothetical protein